MYVMHSCDNKLCVNPSHLLIGSAKDNKLDSVRKLRHAYGERNGGGGKLKEVEVAAIKRLQEMNYGCTRLSRMFGVSATSIKQIKRGQIWRSVCIGNERGAT